MIRLACASLLAALLAPISRADIELPALFAEGMVLQREVEIPVWGRAAVGEHVSVRLADDHRETIADGEGYWSLTLDPLPAGGPFVLEVSGANTIRIEDILVGEVWLGSGQSNMTMTARHCTGFEEEAARSNLPRIRLFHEASGPSPKPQWKGKGHWVRSSPESVADFSAVLFYFGRRLHEELDVPVGLIESSMSGTPIQSWTSRGRLLGSESLRALVIAEDRCYRRYDPESEQKRFDLRQAAWQEEVERARAAGRAPAGHGPKNKIELYMRQGGVAGLFNGKIAPLAPYAIRGVVWYQGEQNVRRVWCRNPPVHQAQLYQQHLEALVHDWRSHWGREDLPFVWVQLPNFVDGRTDDDWPTVRECMRRALAIPSSGMIVAIDQGEPHNIHPFEKREISRRLAMWALGDVYGREGVISGPLYTTHEVRGESVVVSFDHVDGGLREPEGGLLAGFELAGADGTWQAAEAHIEGDTVVVSSPAVTASVAVRYAWSDDPEVTLFDGAGLPASPFTSANLDGSLPR